MTLVLRPRINRILNIGPSVAYALTIMVGAIGEWPYYGLASAVEVVLLGFVAHDAWTWPRLAPSETATEPVTTPRAMGASAG